MCIQLSTNLTCDIREAIYGEYYLETFDDASDIRYVIFLNMLAHSISSCEWFVKFD